MKALKMNGLGFFLLFLLLALQYQLWFMDGGIFHARQMKGDIQQVQQHNDQLIDRNQAVAVNINHLKKSTELVEEKARSELGMVKQGEQYYQVIEGESH